MMESDLSKRQRERVANLGAALNDMFIQNREGAHRYEQSGRLSRWLIRHRESEVFEQYKKVEKARTINHAIESVQEARFAAQAEAASIWIY
jgi:hypothetical protein